MNAEDQRVLRGELTQAERKGLRASEAWETCLNSFLDSAKPSSIREWLKTPEEARTFLDSKAVQLLHRTGLEEEETEVLKDLFPMPEEDEPEETPLSPEESAAARKALL